jgi:hypothetical protein
VAALLQRDRVGFDSHLHAYKKCSETLLAMENLLVKLHAARTIAHETEALTHTVHRENPIMQRKQGREEDSQQDDDNDQDNNNDEDTLPPVEFYDHANCDDCLFVQSLGTDCAMHIASVQHFAEESTMRLQSLFSMRERLRDKATRLEAFDWGENI